MSDGSAPRSSAVSSVDRAISILQVLARDGASGVTTLSTSLGISKSTVFRLLSILEARGLVEQSANRGDYQLGYGVVQLAAGATRKHDLTVISRPICQETAEAVGETVNVAVNDGADVVSIDQVIGTSAVTTVNWVGQRTPMHATSAGLVFLAHLSPEKRRELLTEPLKAYTEHTVTDVAALERRLEDVRTRDYAFTCEEHEIGLSAVAAPIRDIQGTVIAALTISGPSFRFHTQTIGEVLEHLFRAADAISERNGYAKNG